ncbi:short chain isoprenyl diphosphate synthase IdsA [Methanobacterium sp.]|uniref:short chain isoprenyl diphosphate synthase IdsA n=1 Tax=Methanobacterium sp. TaxID=2164 RepID=UPI002ABCB540|nr:short chain isoprenyl diphosphate synthase IdsA [Methanobacterium sp.]MDY9922908.1 short chain isoprenyl diphosphate synthase IdsA [Methanobacterium sp.]
MEVKLEVTEILKRYSADIDQEITRALETVDPEALQQASEHLVKAGGKKLRPSLVVLSSEAVGGPVGSALKTGAAVELIHTFSLIHDDIMDQDEKRRGKPSVHVLWGEPMAILAGDTLFSKAFSTVLKSEEDGVAPEKILPALHTVVDSCVKICEGQAMDMGFAERTDVREEEYLTMIYKKTAALIAAATKAGAILGGGTPEQVEALAEYGRLIGMAFQIQDDYLDVASSEEDLGKPVGSDIVEGKMTLLVVHALSQATPDDRERLLTILKEEGDENVSEAMDILEKYGSIHYAWKVAQEDVNQAKKLLDILDDSPAKESLLRVADFVLERSH